MQYLIQKKINPKIVTFGGCLSRFTAGNLIKMYGGSILSAVYNNRFDMFVDKFIYKKDALPDYHIFKTLLNPTTKQEIIYKRQASETIGIYYSSEDESFENESEKNSEHKELKGKYSNFFDVLNSAGNQVDLVIIDNYIDLIAKGVILKTEEYSSDPFFLPIDSKNQMQFCQFCDYESVPDMVHNCNIIIDYIKKYCVNGKICLLSFPPELYPEDHVIHQRSKDFNNAFANKQIDLAVECHIFSKAYSKNKEHQHFVPAYYSSLAQSIYSSLYS